MPDYLPIVKLYEADGTTLDTSVFAGGVIPQYDVPPEFNWSAYGGCMHGRLSVVLGRVGRPALREGFIAARGQVVQAFLLEGDTAPIWSGLVEECSKEVGGDAHEIVLRGWWDRFEAAVDEELFVGSQAAGTVTVGGVVHDCNEYDTVGKIVKLILDLFVVGGSLGITYDAEEIVGDTPRGLLAIRVGATLKDIVNELACMAEADNIGGDGLVVAAPTRWAYGIGADKKFFFRPIPATAAGTVTLGSSLIEGGRERSAGSQAVARVVVVGAARAARGVRARRTYDYAGWSEGQRLEMRTLVVDSPYEGDLARVAAGWQSRYSATPEQSVDGVAWVETAPAAVPMPWAGLLRWSDPGRPGGALTIDSYFCDMRALLGPVLALSAELGIGAGSAAAMARDPLAPDAVDVLLAGSAAGEALEDGPEASAGIEGDTGYEGVEPPDDAPAQVSAEEAEALGDLYGDVATLAENVGTLQSDVGTLESDVGTLQSDVGTLETDLGLAEGEIYDLQTDLGAAEGDISDLAGDVAALDDRVETLEAGGVISIPEGTYVERIYGFNVS